MQPTPAPTAAADTSAGITYLLAEIGRLDQELKALNKRPLPATETQVKDLVKLAARDRPLEVKVETEEVVKQLVGQMEHLTKQLVATMGELTEGFARNGGLLGTLVDNQTAILKHELGAGVAAVRGATAEMKAGAALIQTKITVDFKQGWRWVAGLLLGPVAFLLLGMGVTGQFSKVSKSDFEQLQAKEQQLQAKNTKLRKEGNYYLKQIEKYKAKNPETTAFPTYEEAK